ncbi:mitochondrial F1-F0 ATP synthase subunit F of fungi-domain-containing protein, partial [Mycena latifolia]
RRALGGLVPSKIATPKLVSGDSTGPLGLLVAFYSKLPKGPAPASAMRGLKGRYFSGKNASAAPVLALIGGIFLIGYTVDYQRAFAVLFVLQFLLIFLHSAPEYVAHTVLTGYTDDFFYKTPQESRALDVPPRYSIIDFLSGRRLCP